MQGHYEILDNILDRTFPRSEKQPVNIIES